MMSAFKRGKMEGQISQFDFTLGKNPVAFGADEKFLW